MTSSSEPMWPQDRPVSIPPRFRQPDVAPVNDISVPDAARMARFQLWRGFRIGLGAGVLIGAFLASSLLLAETISISGSMVSIAPSDAPGELAVVTFENVQMNGPQDNGTYPLAMPGLTVDVVFAWEVDVFGSDRVTIIPPDGIICRPTSCEATAMEGFPAEVVLLEWVGM